MSPPEDLPPSSAVPCDGWWEEEGLGRQPMLEMSLSISAGQIAGSGWDVVGPFTLRGTISDGGAVAMIKQYIGQHQVEYLGTFDGEGGMYGQWRIGDLSDRWAIRFQRPKMGDFATNDDWKELA